jgi:hypothetical protein
LNNQKRNNGSWISGPAKFLKNLPNDIIEEGRSRIPGHWLWAERGLVTLK